MRAFLVMMNGDIGNKLSTLLTVGIPYHDELHISVLHLHENLRTEATDRAGENDAVECHAI